MIRVLAVLFAMHVCSTGHAAQPLPAGPDPQNTLILDTTEAVSSNCATTSRRITPSG